MSIIVWDGKRLAADRQANNGNLKRFAPKIWRHGDMLMGGAGTSTTIEAMRAWVLAGAKREDWPSDIKPDESCLWVINRNGAVALFESSPYPLTFYDDHFAEGSGRDFALGAMEMGADAVRAVEIACKFDRGCGGGVDVLEFD